MKPKWHANLILICEKCGKKLSPAAGSENPSVELKNWLKNELFSRNLAGSSRVITSSCLDICPDGKVAVAFTSDRPDRETTAEIIDPVREREGILYVAITRAKGLEQPV